MAFNSTVRMATFSHSFLSPKFNRRDDAYGGSPEKRAKVLFDIIAGINQACGREFSLGIRLSPERFGQRTEEIRDLASELLVDPRLDYLDMSLWDVFKEAHDEAVRRAVVNEGIHRLTQKRCRARRCRQTLLC
jgi:2,4-dienoyl-CoA reductase-like NADH-dependent reductase (Old Yellow Enzyme family)